MSKIVMSMTSTDGENTAYIKKHEGRKGIIRDLKPYYEVSMHKQYGLMPDDSRKLETTSFKSAVHEARAWTGRGTLAQTQERVLRREEKGMTMEDYGL